MIPDGIGTAIAAIWSSGAKGTDALVLVCLAHSLDWRSMDGATGIPSLEIASRIGMARSVVVESLGRLELAGVVEVAPFVNGRPKSRRVRWDVLASYTSPETKRGGVRTPDPSEHRTRPNIGQEVSEHRTGTPPNIGQDLTEHRTLIVPPPPEVVPVSSMETRAPEVAPSPKPKRSASVAPEVAAVWSVYREEQAAIGSKRGESPPKGWGVAARVADPTIGADGMIAVIRWAHRSPHDRAKHLRDGGYLGDTLFRESKAPEYLPLALAWRDGTGPQPKPIGPGILFGGSTFASKAEPAPTFPPPCRRWSNVLARLRLDGDAELVAAWLTDSDLLDDGRTIGCRTAYHAEWLASDGMGDAADMVAGIADALDVPRHRLRFVERPRVALEVSA